MRFFDIVVAVLVERVLHDQRSEALSRFAVVEKIPFSVCGCAHVKGVLRLRETAFQAIMLRSG